MNFRLLQKGVSGGPLVMLTVWLIPFGPLAGGAVIAYLEGPDSRQGLRLGAESGLIGFGMVLATTGWFPGPNVIGMATSGGGISLGPFFGGLFVYVVGLATAGGYVGASLKAKHGESDPSRDLSRQ